MSELNDQFKLGYSAGIRQAINTIWDSGLDPTGYIEDQVRNLLDKFESDED